MHVYLHWIATDETERRRAKPFCRESRLRRPPFYPHQRAPTISQLPPSPAVAATTAPPPPPPPRARARRSFALFLRSRAGLSRFHREAARDLVFSSSLLTLTSRTVRTPRLGHAHMYARARARQALYSSTPESPRFYSAPSSERTRWGGCLPTIPETFGFNLSVSRKFFSLNECGLLSFGQH